MDPQQITAPASSQPSNVIFVTTPVSRSTPKKLPLKSFHFVFGIIQIIIAALMFVMEVAAICATVKFSFGAGIYCGIFIFLSGLLSLLGAKLNSRPLIIACMVLNIIASVLCSNGISWSSIEAIWYSVGNGYYYVYWDNSASNNKFGFGKSIFMAICCFLEFILTIVHASLSCRSVCSCCMPHSNGASGQHCIAYQTTFPAQASGYPLQVVGVAGMPHSTAASGQHGIAYQTTFPTQASGIAPQGADVAGMPPSPACTGPQQPQPHGATAEPFEKDASQCKWEQFSE